MTPFEIMTSKVWANGLVVLVVYGLSLAFVIRGVLVMPVEGSIGLFLGRRCAEPLRNDVARHVPRHDSPLDAAIRTPLHDHAHPLADAVRFATAALVPFLLLLTPLLRLLPMVALGAIVIFAGVQLVDLEEYARLYRVGRLSFVNGLLVTLGVLVIGVVPGIVVGVMLSLIVLLGRLARPVDAVLQRLPETASFHDVGDETATETVPGLIAYRFYAPLVFANADHFMQRVRGLVAARRGRVRCVVIDVQAVTEIDVTAAEMLQRLGAELEAEGIAFKFARANRPLRMQVERLGLGAHLDRSTVFPSVHAAIEAFLREPSGAAPADVAAVAALQEIH